jgi:hypothetical protein
MTFSVKISLTRSYSFRPTFLCPIFVRISAEPAIRGYAHQAANLTRADAELALFEPIVFYRCVHRDLLS